MDTNNASIDELIKALWSSEAPSAANAIRAQGADALPALLKALKNDDRNFDMREYENGYIRSLIIDIGEPAFQALIQALHPKSNLARAAAKTLKGWGDRRAVEYLIRAMLDENTDLNDNHYIIEALGAFKDPKAFEPLKTMLRHESQHIRRFAACALAEYGNISVMPAIFDALKPGGQRYWSGTVESIGEIVRTFHKECEKNGLEVEFIACLREMERLHPKMVAEYYELMKLIPTVHTLVIPGSITGNGKALIFLKGEKPNLAKIKGNAEKKPFSVYASGGKGSNSFLVKTTKPYEETLKINGATRDLSIDAVGSWSIEITALPCSQDTYSVL